MQTEKQYLPDCIAYSVTCLTVDKYLTADTGVASWILDWSHTFVEIDHEIISMVNLLPSADSRRVVVSSSKSMSMKYWLTT